MNNLTHEPPLFLFSVNGGDLQTTKVAFAGPLLLLVLPSLIFWYGLSDLLPDHLIAEGWNFYLLIFVMILSIASVFRLFDSLQKGGFTRFEISIDKERQLISAFDRKNGLKLWEEDFDPNFIYLSAIQATLPRRILMYP